jgi:hypothetical protein
VIGAEARNPLPVAAIARRPEYVRGTDAER